MRDVAHRCGPLPRANEVDEGNLLNAILRDKKTVAGHVQWVLLERIGRPRIVDGKMIPHPLLRAALRAGLKQEV